MFLLSGEQEQTVISKSCKTRAATNLHDSNRYKCMNRIYSFQEQTVILKKM